MKKTRKSFTIKVLIVYLSLNLIFPLAGIQTSIFQAHALTGGPSQPEFNSFTPIGTSDMVDLASGDFNYNIPIMDVGGYPLNLSYNSGITMDQEASWVGLGWNLNVGQINRNVRGLPDDFDGDLMTYESNLKKNQTVGIQADVNLQAFGTEALNVGAGLTVQYNNYEGVTFKPSFGFSFSLSENVSVGMNLSSATAEGVSVSPNVSIHSKAREENEKGLKFGSSVGVGYNSRQGLTSFNMSASANTAYNFDKKGAEESSDLYTSGASSGGGISFGNNTFTPSKRHAFKNSSFTFGFSFGVDFWGIDGELGLSAFGNIQEIKESEKHKKEKAYGYQFTHNASKKDILDFNRENDQQISRNTLVLPTTNYTYDVYSIKGQGIGGMYRPFRGQVGYIYDQLVEDTGHGGSLSLELEGASGFHGGADYVASPSNSHTGVWNTNATSYFKEKINGNNIDYQNVYFKSIGELNVDTQSDLLPESTSSLGGYSPISLKIAGGSYGKYAKNEFRKKSYNENGYNYEPIIFNTKIKRNNREKSNTAIQNVTRREALNDPFILQNEYAQPHHTAGYKIIKNDGSVYVYGETAYNINKEEVSFAVNGNDADCSTGLVGYNQGTTTTDNTLDNKKGNNHYFNKVITPSYANSYLLTSVLSSNYEDINNNGPDEKDLGSYTKFTYQKKSNYKWRVPYSEKKGSYNAGLNTIDTDEKASYLYGEKEIKYIKKIETKTHVAIFNLSKRKDGFGVKNDDGGGISTAVSRMYKINSIELYSKPDFDKNYNESETLNNATPIKTANFIYNYSLSPHILNNFGGDSNNEANEPDTEDGIDANYDKGKLTLQKVYFTYANSNMGKYTPYQFNYDGYKTSEINDLGEPIYIDNNYPYSLKAYDIWGNYKPNDNTGCDYNDDLTTSEFPFVNQDRAEQDIRVAAWTLSSIDLPSGGEIELEFEADDYQFVQNRKAMQMLKIKGVTRGGGTPNSSDLIEGNQGVLYTPGTYNNDVRYVIIEVDQETNLHNFEERYISSHIDKPIYFRFLVNMTNDKYDYVEGYFRIERTDDFIIFEESSVKYAAIPVRQSDMEGGVNGNKQVNPFSKAGWYFGRQYMNRMVYGFNNDPNSENIKTIAKKLVTMLPSLLEVFQGPNAVLRNNKACARKFNPKKSWIRLQNPGDKLGGGARVKKLKMHDQWASMVKDNPTEDEQDLYNQFYGQEYTYELEENAGSSGVATFEPNSSKENPFVEPFYNKGERLVAPREVSYVEKPFGISFFPSATITYSRVEVKNLERSDDLGRIVKNHATGKVVNKFFTSYNFPTIADYTNIDKPSNYASNEGTSLGNILGGFLGLKIKTKTELTFSQGFVVITNDMNGKTQEQEIFNEQGAKISSVEYIYSTNADETRLENNLPTIDAKGVISNANEIGIQYDVINDFRESYSYSRTFGIDANLAVFFIGIFPIIVPRGISENAEHTKTLHTAVTTKVIHNTGILKEKIATDLGARVSTENLAWDAVTGQVLVTKTKNEYDDAYYSINYPAHWYYKNMGLATNNLNLEGEISLDGANGTLLDANASDYLIAGDELDVFGIHQIGAPPSAVIVHPVRAKLWVAKIDTSTNIITLIDATGKIIGADGDLRSDIEFTSNLNFKIVRSGYRNLQSASMASITLMDNPIYTDDTQLNLKSNLPNYTDATTIINASAIEYTDLWSPQCECLGIPNFSFNFTIKGIDGQVLPDNDNPETFATVGFNPYLYNVKGNYKAVKSYAYLTKRTTNATGNNNVLPRNDGYFAEFNPFYSYSYANSRWTIDRNKWTFASQVSKYSPYGVELENKDALGRYSSAQYGFNYTLPTAVSSNAKYTDMGYDSFEDYQSNPDCTTTHFAYRQAVDTELGNAEIINTESHTGHRSIKVKGQTRATLEKRIDNSCD